MTEPLTMQRYFEVTVRYLRNQHHQAMIGPGCAHLAPDGNVCAVGLWIPAGHPAQHLNLSVRSLAGDTIGEDLPGVAWPDTPDGLDLAMTLQGLHDIGEYRLVRSDDTGLDGGPLYGGLGPEGEDQVRAIAADFDLVYPDLGNRRTGEQVMTTLDPTPTTEELEALLAPTVPEPVTEPLTLQRYFTETVEYLRHSDRAVKPATNGNACAYLTPAGRRCAVGHWIPVGHPAESFTGTVKRLAVAHPGLDGVAWPHGRRGRELAMTLQGLHDVRAYRGSGGYGLSPAGEDFAALIAEGAGLVYTRPSHD